jgi:hypothetical protein
MRSLLLLPSLALALVLGACDDGMPAGPGFVNDLSPGEQNTPLSCEEVRGPTRRLVRLTAIEYQNTVRDLLQVDGDWVRTFPADPVVHGFGRAADELLVTPLLADKLQAAAEEIAAHADLARFAPCMSTPTTACLETLASALGPKLFRRPITKAELAPYVQLGNAAPTPLEGGQRILAAMLQSPRFLYRTELGTLDSESGLYLLGDYEVASELSYLLWQTTPDQVLLDAAEQGALHSAEDIEHAVQRMLQDPRSRPVLTAFIKDWLGLSAIATVPKDSGSFPELTAEVRSALALEAERFIDHVLFTADGSISALLTGETTFLDPLLAKFYGLSDPSSVKDGEARKLSEQDRRGILTLGGTMLVHARSNDSSPVHRGRLIRERLLCETLPPPPAGIVIEPPALDPEKTSRERYAAHSQQEPCASCHKLMDPIGFAFEHFDGIGRYRADDHGQAIDDSGQILARSDVKGDFAHLGEMIDRLAKSEQVSGCYARSLLRFAYQLNDDERGECLAKRSEQAFVATDGTLGALTPSRRTRWMRARRNPLRTTSSSRP